LLLWLVSVVLCFGVVASLVCLVASLSGGLARALSLVGVFLCLAEGPRPNEPSIKTVPWYPLVGVC